MKINLSLYSNMKQKYGVGKVDRRKCKKIFLYEYNYKFSRALYRYNIWKYFLNEECDGE